jgi:hypothetical protein
MCEPRVLRAGKGEAREPELSDPPESLHLGCIEEPYDDRLLFVLERHQAVDGVTEQHA